jgi:hypothetical protein
MSGQAVDLKERVEKQKEKMLNIAKVYMEELESNEKLLRELGALSKEDEEKTEKLKKKFEDFS